MDIIQSPVPSLTSLKLHDSQQRESHFTHRLSSSFSFAEGKADVCLSLFVTACETDLSLCCDSHTALHPDFGNDNYILLSVTPAIAAHDEPSS